MKSILYCLVVVSLLGYLFYLIFSQQTQDAFNFVKLKAKNKYTIDDRLNQFGVNARARLLPNFEKTGVSFPPKALTLLAFKDTKQLEVYAQDSPTQWKQIKIYPIQATSGKLGPKLREGDKQVPEGIYAVELLNPNSAYHVSLRLNYPNAFDQRMGAVDGRTELGSDIMIHGKNVSIGCLAMGDTAAEELFALTAWVGKENLKVIIAPKDFRTHSVTAIDSNLPAWTKTLYEDLQAELSQYPTF